jgi:hypothetical protein
MRRHSSGTRQQAQVPEAARDGHGKSDVTDARSRCHLVPNSSGVSGLLFVIPARLSVKRLTVELRDRLSMNKAAGPAVPYVDRSARYSGAVLGTDQKPRNRKTAELISDSSPSVPADYDATSGGFPETPRHRLLGVDTEGLTGADARIARDFGISADEWESGKRVHSLRRTRCFARRTGPSIHSTTPSWAADGR